MTSSKSLRWLLTVLAALACEDTPTKLPVSAEDRVVLEVLYAATAGRNWLRSANWLTDAPLYEWYGVDTDDAGRVTRLNLVSNRLTGPIPATFLQLTELTHLLIQRNDGLCVPDTPAFQAWLNALAYHDTTMCPKLLSTSTGGNVFRLHPAKRRISIV